MPARTPASPAPLRVGQIGAGPWGANLLRNLGQNPDIRVTWVADLDPARLASHAAAPGVRATADAGALLRADDVDAVVIAAHASAHYGLARQALAAGKHVLVEKPLALTAAECRTLTAEARQAGRTLMVGHTFLYNAAVLELKAYLRSGRLGNVLYMYGQRLNLGRVRRDVNVLWNLGPHDVSILLFLLEDDPLEVSAQGFAYLQPGLEDVAFITLAFPGGRVAHLHLSWLDPHKVRRLTVVGTEQMAVYDDTSLDRKLVLMDRGVDRVSAAASETAISTFAEFQLQLRDGDITIPKIHFVEPLRVEVEHFVHCVRTGTAPRTDGVHAERVVRVLEAAQQSMERNGQPEAPAAAP